MFVIHDLEQKFSCRLGTCFHNTFLPASQLIPGRQRGVVLRGTVLSDAAGTAWGPGAEGRGLGSATHWLEAEAGRDEGVLGRAGPARREQQLCLNGKLRLVLCKLERDQNSKGGV